MISLYVGQEEGVRESLFKDNNRNGHIQHHFASGAEVARRLNDRPFFPIFKPARFSHAPRQPTTRKS